MTDNGHAYRSHEGKATCQERGRVRIDTRPDTPRTNGTAERFITTAREEWVYRDAYPTSNSRTRALPGWVRWYDKRRPHAPPGGRPR